MKNNKIKYFINCYKYIFNNVNSWHFTVQFKNYLGENINIETVQWFADNIDNKLTIQDVEEYFEKMWACNGSNYYD